MSGQPLPPPVTVVDAYLAAILEELQKLRAALGLADQQLPQDGGLVDLREVKPEKKGK